MASRNYFTLIMRDRQHSLRPWSPQFGDYDRATVEDEADYYVDQGFRRGDLKIITTGPKQADINAAIAALNGNA